MHGKNSNYIRLPGMDLALGLESDGYEGPGETQPNLSGIDDWIEEMYEQEGEELAKLNIAECNYLSERGPIRAFGEYDPEKEKELTEKYGLVHIPEMDFKDIGRLPIFQHTNPELSEYQLHQMLREDIHQQMFFLPTADLHYVNLGDGDNLFDDLRANPEFQRLRGIKQLGVVGYCPHIAEANQTRAMHSELVALMAARVLKDNGMDEYIPVAIAAGLYHDIAIPALSDHGKLVKENVEEEALAAGYVIYHSKEIMDALEKYNIDPDEVIAAIEGGHPVLSPLINSDNGIDLDNCAYLALDIRYVNTDKLSCYNVLNEIMDGPSRPLEAWKNLRYVDTENGKKEWVFTDPEQLYALTMFRAHMYKMVYQAPISRAREALMAHVFRHLHQKGLINPKDFLKYNDRIIEEKLEKVMIKEGMGDIWRDLTWVNRMGVEEQFCWRDYKATEGRLERQRIRWEDDPNMIVQFQKGTRAAIGTKTLKNGKVMTLKEAYPIQAREIEKMMDELTYIGIYKYGDKPTFDISNEELVWMFDTVTSIREQHLESERLYNEPDLFPGMEFSFIGIGG